MSTDDSEEINKNIARINNARYQRTWRKKNPDKKKKQDAKDQRAWRKRNPDKKKKQNAEWNAKYRNEYQREYYAKKKKNAGK